MDSEFDARAERRPCWIEHQVFAISRIAFPPCAFVARYHFTRDSDWVRHLATTTAAAAEPFPETGHRGPCSHRRFDRLCLEKTDNQRKPDGLHRAWVGKELVRSPCEYPTCGCLR